MNETDPLLTTTEAADYARVTRAHLGTLRFRRTGPAYLQPTPRTILYRRSALDEWLKQSEQNPNAAHVA